MPEMGESVTEGTVLEWHVAEGDSDQRGRHDRRGLDRQGRRRGSGADERHRYQAPGRGGRGGRCRSADGGDMLPLLPRLRLREQQLHLRPRLRPAEPPKDQRRTAAPPDARQEFAGKATPVARRIAAERGVDLAKVNGSGSGGKVTKEDVLAAADGNGGRPGAGRRAAGEAKPLRGPAGDAGQGDGREPRDPDGDLVPDAPRGHPRRQAPRAQRGAQGARDEGLLHPPDRLGDRRRRRANGR